MPQSNFIKEAANIRSLKDIGEALSDVATKANAGAGKQVVSKIKENIPNQVSNQVLGNGTNSLVTDVVTGGLNKIHGFIRKGKSAITGKAAPTTPLIGEKITNGYKKMQSRLADVDIDLGAKADDIVRKRRTTKASRAEESLKQLQSSGASEDKIKFAKDKADALKNKINAPTMFDHSYQFSGITPDINGAKQITEVGVPMLSAPVNKLGAKVVPMAGTMAVGSAIYNLGNKKEEQDIPQDYYDEGGEQRMAQEKQQAMQKVAAAMNGKQLQNKQIPCTIDSRAAADMLTKASGLLKQASEINKSLLQKNQALSMKVEELEKTAAFKAKSEKVKALTTELFDKGLVKKAEIEDMNTQLLSFDDEAFELFKTAFEKVDAPTPQDDGISDLTFLSKVANIEDEERPSLASEIIKTAEKFN